MSNFPCSLTRNMENLLFIAYSDERWLYYQFSLPHLYVSLQKVCENVLFGLWSERVKISPISQISPVKPTRHEHVLGWSPWYWQLPPFWQGFFAQCTTTGSEKKKDRWRNRSKLLGPDVKTIYDRTVHNISNCTQYEHSAFQVLPKQYSQLKPTRAEFSTWMELCIVWPSTWLELDRLLAWIWSSSNFRPTLAKLFCYC